MNKLWGGRFSKATNAMVEDFSRSIHYDQVLAKYDCLGSLAHIDVLKRAKLLSAAEHRKLNAGLKKILRAIEKGTFDPDPSFEDIHSYIQALLEKPGYAGAAALKLHTCRSRNDQVVFDTKYFCLEEILKTEQALLRYMQSLSGLAKRYSRVYLPGYTHLQHAIPVAFEDYCHTYIRMAQRDEDRLLHVFNSIDLTMGSGALAGTMIPAAFYNQKENPAIKKRITAPQNALDTVSDRDFVIDALAAMATIGLHLSRLSEDLILWATSEFDFIEIDDAFCTGSSLMPNKKNPDVLELVRGQTGRLYGNLISVLVTMKGLPLSYNRDMQLDKEPLFSSFTVVQDSLKVLADLLAHLTLNEDRIKAQLDDEALYATDLADFLVRQNVPFKTAHHAVGQLIQAKLSRGAMICDMDDAALKVFHPLLNRKAVQGLFNPESSVRAKKSVLKRSDKGDA